MIVELLYLPGCPNHGVTADLVHSVLKAEGMPAELQEIPITDYEDASTHDFPGSPTIRVNGRDIENIPSYRLVVGYACRTYLVEGKQQGVPPRSSIERAIRAAQTAEENQP
ncbi:MAG TPA: hypothetical protein VG225_07920 [Terracidiphilus sp.]|jgi:hypothetical protein|nr:hypothetical protein [Terracidiphilus sp.]